MQIKYIGPRVVISHLGLSFKEGKNDKYTYLKAAMQILKAIKHEYIKDTIYNYDMEDNSSDSSILEEVLKFNNNHVSINEKIKEFDNFLENEIKDLHIHFPILKEEELLIYRKNLELMKEYRKQRKINKTIYEALVGEISSYIISNEIKDLETPFNEQFWHVLQSIEGSLSNKKTSSKLDTKIQNDNIIIYLLISKYIN